MLSFAAGTETTPTRFGRVARQDSFSVIFNTAMVFLVCAAFIGSTWAQVAVSTSRADVTRSGANTNETLLRPGNVNSGSFGHLFSAPLDYQVLAQPLVIPAVNIPGQGIHDVVYLVTQANSVYAIDASNGTQLWHVNVTASGGAPASGSYLPCASMDGFTEEGIVGTPVIDPTTNTMYLVAKSVVNGTVVHYLHALDIATGSEQTGLRSPVQIVASSVSKKGRAVNFNSLHQKNRPGMLLLNGVLYLGFGSNGCNDRNTGWVLAYSAANVQQQLGAFNTSPDTGFISVWQSGSGLAADEAGNVFFTTAEGTYDIPAGGQAYANSVLKLTPPPWSPQNTPDEPADYFTPWDVAYFDTNDKDVSSGGPVILPDQDPGPSNCSHTPCHELVAAGKVAMVYVLDRDNMGQFANAGGQLTSDPQILQEYQLTTTSGDLDETPAYWNGLLYYAPPASPLQVLQVSNGLVTPFAQTAGKLTAGTHSPSISANGNTNGILWLITGTLLQAYDAISLRLLYSTSQVPSRDGLPPLAHFATQTVANGRVYVATQNSLEAYGLFPALSVTSGNGQSAPVLGSVSIQILASDPYTGQAQPGVTVSFGDGNKGGTFNPSSAVTKSSGVVSTTFTFPKTAGAYTLTASAANFASATASETALPLAPVKIVVSSGGGQTGVVGSVLPNPIVVQVQDTYKNPVPGVTVSFSPSGGATNPTSAITDAKGSARTTLTLPTKPGTVTVKATSGSLTLTVSEKAVAGPLASEAD